MTTTLAVTGPATPTTAPPQRIASDFNTFLKMLTTQMQNQDPLNPIDSADYAVQLATFSGVEQQVRTNDLLAGLGAQFGLMGMAQLAGWVGQEARAAAPVWMEGTPVTVLTQAKTGADRAMLVVRDAQGNTVAREPVPVGAESILWAGQDAAGNPLPMGQYDLTLESWKGDAMLGAEAVESYARITEARNTAEGVVLVLNGGVEVPASRITALRQAP